MLAAIQVLNRLECVGEPLRQTLNILASEAADWLQAWVPPGWFDRYSRRFEADRLPAEKALHWRTAEDLPPAPLLISSP